MQIAVQTSWLNCIRYYFPPLHLFRCGDLGAAGDAAKQAGPGLADIHTLLQVTGGVTDFFLYKMRLYLC